MSLGKRTLPTRLDEGRPRHFKFVIGLYTGQPVSNTVDEVPKEAWSGSHDPFKLHGEAMDVNETLKPDTETRPRPFKRPSRDRDFTTETLRPRLQPCSLGEAVNYTSNYFISKVAYS